MRKTAAAFIVILALVFGAYVMGQVRYILTSSSYEELAAARPRDRSDVLRLLTGFSEEIITNPKEMASTLRDDWGEGKIYARYYRYKGHPIDVIYKGERVEHIWPTFE